MAEQKQIVKLNKNHGGKEFRSFFHFVGKVTPTTKFEDGQRVQQQYFVPDTTQTGKPRRKLQFNLLTDKSNELKMELTGYQNDYAFLYSQADRKSKSIAWDDRLDKTKYPNDSYHLIETDWDKAEQFIDLIEDDAWVEVKGHYEFGSFIDEERGKVNFRKRIVDSVESVKDGQEIKAGNRVILDKYVTDFHSEEFKEINFVTMQIGINSTYQEDDEKDTTINAYFLNYGKERSTPHQTQVIVPYSEPEDGKTALSNAFLKLDRFDFVEVEGTDNNRAIFSDVEVEPPEVEGDPFSNVGENDKSSRNRLSITGTDKGIKVSSIVNGTFVKDFLTEEEVKEVKLDNNNPFNNKEDVGEEVNEDDPFNGI